MQTTRKKDKFRYEEKGEIKIILQVIVLLSIFRASKVGQNQIASVYILYLHRSANKYAFSFLHLIDLKFITIIHHHNCFHFYHLVIEILPMHQKKVGVHCWCLVLLMALEL